MAKDKDITTDEIIKGSELETEQVRQSFLIEEWDDVIDLAEAKKELGLEHVHVSPRSVAGDTFLILGAKEFESKYPDQDGNPYFCTCFDEVNKEYFTVVLGGAQPIQVLTRYIETGAAVPIRVVLNFHEGEGKFGGYYTLD